MELTFNQKMKFSLLTSTGSVEKAKEAMNGILSNQDQCDFASSEAHYEENVIHTIPRTISQYAVACADALIAELKGDEK